MTDHKAHATREAVAILEQFTAGDLCERGTLVDLLAVAWLQGAIYGSHETLAGAEIALEKVRAEL